VPLRFSRSLRFDARKLQYLAPFSVSAAISSLPRNIAFLIMSRHYSGAEPEKSFVSEFRWLLALSTMLGVSRSSGVVKQCNHWPPDRPAHAAESGPEQTRVRVTGSNHKKSVVEIANEITARAAPTIAYDA
jgi:hypothetical protein